MKNLLQVIGFQPKENAKDIFTKKYQDSYVIEIDIKNEIFHFGGKIKVQGKDSQNITKSEDWVVLECVDRLLTKGYKPENISLEKVYPAGHGFSGRLDICVTRDDGSEYLLIECKTYGKEFDKEFNRINKDGGQLFTYFKFSNKADIIMLYASELKGKNILYKNEIVKIEDDYKIGDVKDFYEKWNKLTKDNGIFDSWVNPYNFESKALTINDLEEIKQEDSSFIFNRFLEILRHNVVSDKGNAFNRIFTLFLCKIYDEKDKEDTDNELEFQWFESPFTYEGIHYEKDNHVSFQIRLTDLYKKGMKAFLEKNVTDFSEAEFHNKYSFLSEEQRKPILEEFRKVRLEKNNEFAIKDVYDEQSFYDNAVVVKEIVELLQSYKLRYTKKQQYLSDFFELLLTTGLKQESGQFFTPVPVAQFVIKSLPIDTIIKEKLEKGEKDEYLPYIIDYAAGSGHFLTETMHEVQRIIDNSEFPKIKAEVKRFVKQAKEFHFDWAFDYVYGIEKDYRLVKVGKVGCYLHGDGLANVIHSDGLANFKHKDYKGKLSISDKNFEKENKQFDIIVSNPPYSVSAFRNAARQFYKDGDFELYNKLTDNSSEIECLFIERTKQLLRDGGVAGIILPSSILSNTGIYSKSREIILQYFDIVGITELGSNTFMATGTNTVTLFLRRKNNYESKNLRIAVDRFFNDYQDVTLNGVEKPITKYINHVWENISLDDYISILKKDPTENINQHEIYKEYCKKIKAYSQIEILKNQISKAKNDDEISKLNDKKVKAEKEFWNTILEIENEKLLYFIIAYPQKVVLVKSGEKDAEKRFLGYEFSNRRGSEGIHPIQRGKNIEDCTQLFDAEVFDNPEKASTYIYKAFAGDYDFPIDEEMQNNVFRHDLVDMMTFDRADFEKNISLSVKKKVKFENIWGTNKLQLLGEISEIKKGTSITKEKTTKGIIPVIAGGQEPAYFHNESNRKGKVITVSASGAYAGFVNYFENPIFASDCNTIVSKNENVISTKLIYLFLKSIQNEVYGLQRGQAQPHVYGDDLSNVKIPLPPIDIQQKIVSEIEVLEQKENKAKEEVEKLRNEISERIRKIFSEKKSNTKIGNCFNLSSGKMLSAKDRIDGKYPIYGGNGITGYHNEFLVDFSTVVIGRVGEYCGSIHISAEKSWITDNALYVTEFLLPTDLQYLFYILKESNLNQYANRKSQPSISQANIKSVEIPLPSLSEQQKIVSEIEKIEAKMKVLETEIAKIPKLKEIILKKYL